MKYEIIGDNLPVVICELEKGESVFTESGGMSWMTPTFTMSTDTGGGLGKALGRKLAGDSIFQNTYTANAPGKIAFASSFPGSIVPFEVGNGKEYIFQKRAFLAAEKTVTLSTHVNRKVSGGLFGGEGFILQKVSGNGIVFAEFDGTLIKYDLQPGQEIVVSTGHLAAMDASVQMRVETVKGAKNMFLGGEGLFNTYLSGPGSIWLQTMPLPAVAGALAPYITTGS